MHYYINVCVWLDGRWKKSSKYHIYIKYLPYIAYCGLQFSTYSLGFQKFGAGRLFCKDVCTIRTLKHVLKKNTMVYRIRSSQLGRPATFSLEVFIFIIYFAHFSSDLCIDFFFRWLQKKVGRCLWATATFVELKTAGIIHLAISGKPLNKEKKQSFFAVSTKEKLGRCCTSRKHHARKRAAFSLFFFPHKELQA